MEAESARRTERQHLATVSFDGRFWDAYLDFTERPDSAAYRAFVSFSQADAPDEDPVSTTVIFIEPSLDDILLKARSFSDHQLVSLLRSARSE